MPLLPSLGRSPLVLLVALVVAVFVAIAFATTTTTTAFGPYNPAWDGISGLESRAAATDTPTDVVVNTTAYRNVDPRGALALVFTPDTAYGPTDRERLRGFVRDGGTLVVAEDFGPNSNPLLAALGAAVRVDGRLVRDERHNYRSPNISIATDVAPHPLTRSVDQLTLNHGTVLTNVTGGEGTRALVNTSRFAYLDGNRNSRLDTDESLERRPVAAVESIGEGRVIVLGDPSLLINAMLDRPGNQAFVRTLFASHDRVLLDYSHAEPLPPVRAALLAVRDSAPLQVSVGVTLLLVVVLAVRYGRRIRTAVPFRGRTGTTPVDESDIATRLRAKHPNWDEERIERVATSRLGREHAAGESFQVSNPRGSERGDDTSKRPE